MKYKLSVVFAAALSLESCAFTFSRSRARSARLIHLPVTAQGRSEPPPDFTIDDDNEDGFEYSEPVERVPKPPRFTNDREKNDGEHAPLSPTEAQPRRRKIVQPPKRSGAPSWMERNSQYAGIVSPGSARNDDFSSTRERRPSPSNNRNRPYDGARTFREDFRGTRVFVEGIPKDASWQDVKDHFRVAGEVVFASISTDRVTGESKGQGIVQFETTDMAQNAIQIMRDHPLDGNQLYVREDMQRNDGRAPGMPKGPTPPTKWKCANEDNMMYLSDGEIKTVRNLIKARDDARRRRKYDAADQMREELKTEYGVHIDDRLKMWWTSEDGSAVPGSIKEINGDGRWGLKAWRQIPTTPENDYCVDSDLVEGLLKQRDIARREKDFSTADRLLEEARTAPDGDLYLRIHDESRTWRIWTDAPPPRAVEHRSRDSAPRVSPRQQCLDLVTEHAPHKLEEITKVLEGFPGREYQVLKRLKKLYL